jgi:hypothetical protein
VSYFGTDTFPCYLTSERRKDYGEGALKCFSHPIYICKWLCKEGKRAY